MATYEAGVYVGCARGTLLFEPDRGVRCDGCSTFEPEGFASDGRSWTPLYGVRCESCGESC